MPDMTRSPYVLYPSDRVTVPSHRPDASWEDLRRLVCDHAPTPCESAACLGRECPHKKVAAWSPVRIEGTRLNANVRGVTAMVLDVDHWEPDEDSRWLEELSGSGLLWALATSHQHHPDAPRLRVVLPLSREATPEEYPRLRRAFLSRTGIPADPRTGDLSRIYYLPTSRADVAPEAHWSEGGAPLDVDAEIAAAPPAPPELPLPEGGVADWATTTSPAPTPESIERLRASLRELPPRGQGRGATYQAFSLVFHDWGLSLEDGWEVLAEWNEGCGEPHDAGSLERQLHRCARRVRDTPRGWRRGGDMVAAILARALAPQEGTWEDELRKADADVARSLVREAGTGRLPMFSPIREVLARPVVEVPWIVEGLIKSRGVHVLGGRSKIGKSWLLSGLAAAGAAGRPVFGRFAPARRLRVAYFFAEELEIDVQGHCAALLAGLGVGADEEVGLHVEPRGAHFDLLDDGLCAKLVASVRRLGGVDLLCLEPLRDLHGAPENESEAMIVVMRRLRQIGDLLGCATAVIHHEGKPGTGNAGRKGGERLRGSGAIYGSADAMFSASPVARTPNRLEVRMEAEIRGARSPEDFGLVLEIEDGPDGRARRASWTAAALAPPEQPGHAPERDVVDAVIAEVERHALGQIAELAAGRDRACACPWGAAVHAADLDRKGAHKVDAPRRKVRAAVRSLLESGRLTRLGGEHGSLLLPRERVAELAAELAAERRDAAALVGV
jgi:AAA domain